LPNRIFIIGLTGPSGAGKSEVVRRLTVNDAVVCIDMDWLARQVTAAKSDCLHRLTDAFSTDILNDDGTLNRKALARVAFSSPQKTQLLNDITHPAIIAETERLLTKYRNDPAIDVVILDAPLLIESGINTICDKVIAVLADTEKRISRICLRDNITKEVAMQRIARQHEDMFYADKADMVVYNNGDEKDLTATATQIIQKIGEWLLLENKKTSD
jgi:dephospho-CoA kinase